MKEGGATQDKEDKEAELEAVKQNCVAIQEDSEDPRSRMKEGGETQGKEDTEETEGTEETEDTKDTEETEETEFEAGKPKGETLAGLEDVLRGLQLQKYEAKAEE
eukprot:6077599-Heterocapsa_arctica.AAC.1